MQGRIRAIALLHQMLYLGDTHAMTDLGSYLQQLATQSFRAVNHSPQIHLELALIAVNVSLDQATYCGLLVNELITNSLKHSFPEGHGTVRVHLTRQEGAQVRLRVMDDGGGLAPEFYAHKTSGLGLQLISDLLGQLGGTYVIEINGGFSVTFAAQQ